MDTATTKSWLVDAFPLLAIGKRLALWLIAVAMYCVLVGLIVRAADFHLPDWSLEAGLLNTVILGLLLGFRNRTAYERWWEARRLWGQLINDTRNLAWQLAAFVPSEKVSRSPMASLLPGFAESLKRHLRGESPTLQEIRGFQQEIDRPAHVPSYLVGRMYVVIAGWKREGILDEAVLRVIAPHLRGFLDVCGACERIRNTPLSPSYRSLLRTGIALNLVIAPWYTMTELGFWGLPILLLICFFILGVELIDSIVEDPFGTERDDLALDRYCQTIRESVEMSLHAGGNSTSAVAKEPVLHDNW